MSDAPKLTLIAGRAVLPHHPEVTGIHDHRRRSPRKRPPESLSTGLITLPAGLSSRDGYLSLEKLSRHFLGLNPHSGLPSVSDVSITSHQCRLDELGPTQVSVRPGAYSGLHDAARYEHQYGPGDGAQRSLSCNPSIAIDVAADVGIGVGMLESGAPRRSSAIASSRSHRRHYSITNYDDRMMTRYYRSRRSWGPLKIHNVRAAGSRMRRAHGAVRRLHRLMSNEVRELRLCARELPGAQRSSRWSAGGLTRSPREPVSGASHSYISDLLSDVSISNISISKGLGGGARPPSELRATLQSGSSGAVGIAKVRSAVQNSPLPCP